MASAVSWFNFLANECVAVLEAFGLNLGISSSVPRFGVASGGGACLGACTTSHVHVPSADCLHLPSVVNSDSSGGWRLYHNKSAAATQPG